MMPSKYLHLVFFSFQLLSPLLVWCKGFFRACYGSPKYRITLHLTKSGERSQKLKRTRCKYFEGIIKVKISSCCHIIGESKVIKMTSNIFRINFPTNQAQLSQLFGLKHESCIKCQCDYIEVFIEIFNACKVQQYNFTKQIKDKIVLRVKCYDL